MTGRGPSLRERARTWLGITGLIGVVISLTAPPPAAGESRPTVTAGAVSAPSLVDLPLQFEANRGQADPRVLFLGRGQGYTVFLTAGEAVIALTRRGGGDTRAVRMRLVGAAAEAKVRGDAEMRGMVNYFRGKDPARWRTAVPSFERVRYEGAYPGIDVVFYGRQRQLEYDFIVSPGADPAAIRLAFEGGARVRRDATGDLVLAVEGGEMRLSRPLVYQEIDGVRRDVAGEFILGPKGDVGIHVAAFDPSRPLVIDPVLTSSTYLGGSMTDVASGVAVDGNGDVYVTGYTYSNDFPVPDGTASTQPECEWPFGSLGCRDVFVMRLTRDRFSPGGMRLVPVYFTYLGGEHHDEAAGIAVDGEGAAYVTGTTYSDAFPTYPLIHPTPPVGFDCDPACPLQVVRKGDRDAFVTKLDSTGALVYSTYLGGSGSEYGNAIAVDTAGRAHVVGQTSSGDFPLHDTSQSLSGFHDAFAVKLNATGSSLLFSKYLGGSGVETATAVAVRSTTTSSLFECCRVVTATFVTGTTEYAADFPTTHDVAQNGNRGRAFVMRLNNAGGTVYSTRLGSGSVLPVGHASEEPTGIAVDAADNAYVTGWTLSSTFPTRNAVQGGLAYKHDAFVSRINASGSALVYSTYLGGQEIDQAAGIAVDAAGNAFVTGWTASPDFPAVRPMSSLAVPSVDAFVTQLAPDGTLTYSGRMGGSGEDRGRAIALGSGNDVYIVGETASVDLPKGKPFLGNEPWDESCGTAEAVCTTSVPDGFLAKIRDLRSGSSNLRVTVSDTPDPVDADTPLTYDVTVENVGTTAASNVALVQALSPEVTFQTVTPADRCFESAKTVYCNFPSVGAGQSVQSTIVVNVNKVAQ
jgi:uncharacterized repeat protein (TIGR01451 family)